MHECITHANRIGEHDERFIPGTTAALCSLLLTNGPKCLLYICLFCRAHPGIKWFVGSETRTFHERGLRGARHGEARRGRTGQSGVRRYGAGQNGAWGRTQLRRSGVPRAWFHFRPPSNRRQPSWTPLRKHEQRRSHPNRTEGRDERLASAY